MKFLDYELPGLTVDEGETLDIALCREIYEETGISVQLLRVTDVHSNGSNVSVVFCGGYREGNLKTSEFEKQIFQIRISARLPSSLMQSALISHILIFPVLEQLFQ